MVAQTDFLTPGDTLTLFGKGRDDSFSFKEIQEAVAYDREHSHWREDIPSEIKNELREEGYEEGYSEAKQEYEVEDNGDHVDCQKH